MVIHKPSTLAAAIERIEQLEAENERLNQKLSEYIISHQRLTAEIRRMKGGIKKDRS